jgi:hypothetical protein
MGCACKLPVKIIKVDGVEVGLTGINAAFEKIKELNIADNEKAKHELLLRIKFFGNYIPKDREETYQNALFEEYNKYLKQKNV